MATVHHALPRGFKLHEYQIESVLGDGGFGITYLARDINLGKLVAVKEYLPSDLAIRHGQSEVLPKSQSSEDDFLWGLKAFLQEAQTLAHFEHPNIVPVHRFFEANGTAYIVMAFQEGESLYELIDRLGTLDQTTIEAVIFPLLDGLDEVHKLGFLHRDIKPENIYIRTDGTPVLLDFGAARQALGNRTRSLTSIVTRGFAPFEQYTSTGKQGPWSDVYAMGAVMYNAVTGRPPADAPDRMDRDRMLPAVDAGRGRYEPAFLEAIDAALIMRSTERPQSVAEWRGMLQRTSGGGAVPRTAVTATAAFAAETLGGDALQASARASGSPSGVPTNGRTPSGRAPSGRTGRGSGGAASPVHRESYDPNDPRYIMSADQAPRPRALQPIWKRSRVAAVLLLLLLGAGVSGGAFAVLSYFSPDLRGLLASTPEPKGTSGGSSAAEGATAAEGSGGGETGEAGTTGESGWEGTTGQQAEKPEPPAGGSTGGEEGGGSTSEGTPGSTAGAEAGEDPKVKAERERKQREEDALRARIEKEERAKIAAEGKAKVDAARRKQIEEEARAKVRAEIEAERKADAKRKAEEERKRLAADPKAKARAEAEARRKIEAEARAKVAAEERAKARAEARDEARRKAAIEAKARAEAAAQARAEQEAEAARAAEAQRQAEEEAKKKAAEVASLSSLKNTFAGGTVYKMTKSFPRRDDAWKFYPGGAVRGSFTQAHNNPNFPPEQGGDSGTWWVKGNQLCIKWQHWEGGRPICYSVSGKGKRWTANGAGMLAGGFTLLK